MTDQKKNKLLSEKKTMLKYLENGDKEAAHELRVNCCKFYMITIPCVILIVFIVLGIPFGLIEEDFTIMRALKMSFFLTGIPAILAFLFAMLFPSLDDESLYIGIAWIVVTGFIHQVTGFAEALGISFLIIIIFCMWYSNHSKQEKMQKIKEEIYALENNFYR